MLLSTLLNIFVLTIQAQGPLVTWMTFDYAPIYEKNNSGLGDTILHEFQKCLKDYRHTNLGQSTLPRIFKNLDDQHRMFCLPAIGTTPSEQSGRAISKLVFTIPSAFIVIRKNDKKKFLSFKNHISLKKLLQNTKLTGGMVEQGTYGEEVNAILKEYGKNVLKRNPVSPTGFYKMLQQKRFDYFFEYPISFLHHIKNLPLDQRDQFTYLYINENKQSGAIKAYAICSAPSEKIIHKINNCLSAPEIQKTYVEELLKKLPEDIREDYRQLNYKMIGK